MWPDWLGEGPAVEGVGASAGGPRGRARDVRRGHSGWEGERGVVHLPLPVSCPSPFITSAPAGPAAQCPRSCDRLFWASPIGDGDTKTEPLTGSGPKRQCLPGVAAHSLSLRGGTASSNPSYSSGESVSVVNCGRCRLKSRLWPRSGFGLGREKGRARCGRALFGPVSLTGIDAVPLRKTDWPYRNQKLALAWSRCRTRSRTLLRWPPDKWRAGAAALCLPAANPRHPAGKASQKRQKP